MNYVTDVKDCPDVKQLLQEVTELLAAKTRDERISWFRMNIYAEPLVFLREIDGTVYGLRTFFQPDAGEDITHKVERLLLKSSL